MPIRHFLFSKSTIEKEICSKLTIKTPERRQWQTCFTTFSSASIDYFEQVNVSWVIKVTTLLAVYLYKLTVHPHSLNSF